MGEWVVADPGPGVFTSDFRLLGLLESMSQRPPGKLAEYYQVGVYTACIPHVRQVHVV